MKLVSSALTTLRYPQAKVHNTCVPLLRLNASPSSFCLQQCITLHNTTAEGLERLKVEGYFQSERYFAEDKSVFSVYACIMLVSCKILYHPIPNVLEIDAYLPSTRYFNRQQQNLATLVN
jgi:hypothetical protein